MTRKIYRESTKHTPFGERFPERALKECTLNHLNAVKRVSGINRLHLRDGEINDSEKGRGLGYGAKAFIPFRLQMMASIAAETKK